MTFEGIGEFGLIEEIRGEFRYTDPRIIKGIGDDAAVTRIDGERCLLSSVEMLVEGVHFSLSYISPGHLGKKSIGVAVSDIAAMGGTPSYVLLSLGIPKRKGIDLRFVKDLYRGVREATEAYGIFLVGGNVASSPGGLIIGTTVIGEVERGKAVFRSGARPGDRIFVTGTIGDSAVGLRALQAGDTGPYERAVDRHINPLPRVEEGRRLADVATAMIDISDGLLADLGHILEESGVGARVYLSMIPFSKEVRTFMETHPEERFLPLTGGEDYELLFTSSKEEDIERIARERGCPITCIGEIVEGEGMEVIDERGRVVSIESPGFDHLRGW